MQIINPDKDLCYITKGTKVYQHCVSGWGVLFSLFFPTKPYEVQKHALYARNKPPGGDVLFKKNNHGCGDLERFLRLPLGHMTLNSKSYVFSVNSFNLKLSFQDNKRVPVITHSSGK